MTVQLGSVANSSFRSRVRRMRGCEGTGSARTPCRVPVLLSPRIPCRRAGQGWLRGLGPGICRPWMEAAAWGSTVQVCAAPWLPTA